MPEESDLRTKLGLKLSTIGMKELADGVIEEIKNDVFLKEIFYKIDQVKFLALLKEFCVRDGNSLDESLNWSDIFETFFTYINLSI